MFSVDQKSPFESIRNERSTSTDSSAGTVLMGSTPPLKSKAVAKKGLARSVCPQVCAICGAPAIGFHYEVGSCNGCKTFFRRTVVEQRIYECRRNNRCSALGDDPILKCRKCRFDKCVEVGMNPLGIISELNPLGNSVIRDILQKRKILPQDNDHMSSDIQIKILVNPSSVENNMERLINSLLHLELAHQRLRRSSHTVEANPECTMETALAGHSLLGIPFEEMPDWPITAKLPAGFQPSTTIEALIKSGKPPAGPKRPPFIRSPLSNNKLFVLLDVLYAVEYLKTFDFFHKLEANDKRLLARRTALQCSHLTAAFFSYENKSDVTFMPDGQRPWDGVLPDSNHDRMIYKKVITILMNLQLDKSEYVLLKALLVCDPSIEDMSRKGAKLLSSTRERYAKSLLSYVISRRGVAKGPSSYAAMISLVDTVNHIIKVQKEFFVMTVVLNVLSHPHRCPFIDEVFEVPSLST